MKSYEWVLKLVDKISGPMASILDKGEKVEKMMTGVGNSLANWGKRTAVIGLIGGALSQMSGQIERAIAPGAAFEQGLADIAAITDASRPQLDMMGASARQLALTFGGDAAAGLDTYKSILGELGPQLANAPDQLSRMGTAVNILAQTMGGDTVAATRALNTGLQQFNVDLTNPRTAADAMIAQMNIMAAAARAGAAEVPQIADALRLAGVAASGARVSFGETNAMIQVLAQGGLKGAEAGTALRNVISKMGEGRFLPKDTRTELKAAGVDIDKLSDKTVPFRDRMHELQKVQGDSALVSKLFGMENANAATVLLRGVGAIGDYERKIVGTTAAQQMAGVEMDTFTGRGLRLKALWTDLAIGAFDTLKPMLPMIQGFAALSTGVANVWPLLSLLGQGMQAAAVETWAFFTAQDRLGRQVVTSAAKMLWAGLTGVGQFVLSLVTATAAQLGLNVAMTANPIGAVVAGLLAVGAAVYLIIRHWDVVKDWIVRLGAFMLKMNPFYWLVQGIFALFPGVEKWFHDLWGKIEGFLHKMLGKIKAIWDKIGPYLGLGEMQLGVITSPVMESAFAKDPFAGGAGGGKDQGLAQSKEVAKGLEKVSDGGSKPTTVHIHIAKFQDKIEIHTTTLREGTNDMVRMLEEALTRTLNGVSQGVGIQ